MSNKKRSKKSKKNFQNEDDNMSSYSEQSGTLSNSTSESMGISAAVALALDPLTETSSSNSFDMQQSDVPSFGDEFIALGEEPTVSRQEKRFESKKQGRPVKPIPKANDCDFDKCYPWPYEVNKLFDGREIHAYDLLRKDFNDFWVYITPRGPEAKLRRRIKEKYERIIQKVWSNATVSIFGSYVTGLYLPDSDMDMNISFSGRTPHIKEIASQLEKEGLSYNIRVIGGAAVPVIKLVDRKCRMKVDIVVNQSNGMYSAEIVNGYLREYPTARPLTRIIKYYLSQCDLNEVFTGGIGGYAIFSLVVSFLQRHPLVASGQIDPQKNLPTLLLDFLALYGFHFNIDVAGISISGEGYYFYKDGSFSRSRSGQPLYSILDPQDKMNDLGMKSFHSQKVVDAFAKAYHLIIGKMKRLEEELKENGYTKLSYETMSSNQKLSILGSFVYVPLKYQSERADRTNIAHRYN